MRIIENRWIPFKGFKAINLFGVCFVRKGAQMSPKEINHEAVHTQQMRELWYIGFYILYLLEWMYRLVFHTRTAYRGISFEREAYSNENNLNYIRSRKTFAMWRRNK